MVVVIGEATVHLRERRVRTPSGESELTPLEAQLLEFLASHRGRTLSRTELLTRVWGYSPNVQSRAVDNTVSRLRRKIEPDPAQPQWILASRGGGYRLEAGEVQELAPDNLPHESNQFVGRSAEVESLSGRLRGDVRLLTLVGFGGCGKTRLAIRVARSVRDAFPGGVWFCDVSDARDVDGIATALGRALDVDLEPKRPVDQLSRALRRLGKALVVMDNFEQVAQHAVDTLAPWIREPVTLLVTSRTVLGLPEEQVHEVVPLQDDETIDLFVTRRSEMGLEAGSDVPTSLVRNLDGLPLSIELAARRSRTMDPAELAAGMDRHLQLLTAPSGGRPERRTSLRATLDWSWDLSTPAERAVLAQLSVFEGGFTVTDAEQVVVVGPGEPTVADLVASLHDQSLVVRRTGGRLDLLVSVQDYARERLGPTDAAAAEIRHGAAFARRGSEEALRGAFGPDATELRRALAADIDNHMAAARRALDRGDAATAAGCLRAASEALRFAGPSSTLDELLTRTLGLPDLTLRDELSLASALGRLRTDAHRFDAGRGVLERALARARDSGDRMSVARALLDLGGLEAQCALDQALPILRQGWEEAEAAADVALRARANQALGNALFQAGWSQESIEPLQTAATLARRAGDRATLGSSLSQLGLAEFAAGRAEEGMATLRSAVQVVRGANREFEAQALYNLGRAEKQRGNTAQALELFEEAHVLFRESGSVWGETICLGQLGNILFEMGRPEAAVVQQQEALDLARAAGIERLEAVTSANLATALLELGEFARAAELYRAAAAQQKALGMRRSEIVARTNLAESLLAQGDISGAEESCAEAHEVAMALGEPRRIAMCLERSAEVDVIRGRVPQAEARAREALQIYRTIDEPRQIASGQAILCLALLAKGDPEGAQAEAQEGVAVARPLEDPSTLATCLYALAEAEIDLDHFDAARKALDEAESVLPPRRVDSMVMRRVRRCRERLSAAVAATAPASADPTPRTVPERPSRPPRHLRRS